MPGGDHGGRVSIAGTVQKQARRLSAMLAAWNAGEDKGVMGVWTVKKEGIGSRAAGLITACKLIKTAQARRRAVNAPHLLVHAGARFERGVLIERQQDTVA